MFVVKGLACKCLASVGATMKFLARLSRGGLGLLCVVLSGCSSQGGDTPQLPNMDVQSIMTEVGEQSCKKDFDKSDPNETPYLGCPGVAGYSLIVRRVEAGRQSIDVVDESQHAWPLNYQDYITPHMSSLDGKAEWRVATKDGKQVPIALIVRVQARENSANPEKVTGTYISVAKIGPTEMCVTARIPEGTKTEAEIHQIADSAQQSQCVPAQP